jgi:GDP-L-fucose synthase
MSKKILLTGATGFLGRHTKPVLETRYGKENVICVSSSDYDLSSPDEARKMIDEIRPEVVVHYAAYSGGIAANRTFPADFYFRNTLLTANVFDAAAKRNVKKMIYPMGGCSYPAKATSPIGEDQLWNGYPQEESAGYSTAKMMGIVAAKSYLQQYGMDTVVLIPGNMYGEYDNFNSLESHVVPAMIRRYYEANLSGASEVEMWGTGAPQRDFVYAGDVAKTIPFFIENFDEVGPINISSGISTPIRTLAEDIARLVEYSGRISWDSNKPDGQMIKIFDAKKLHDLGLRCDTSLYDGLKKTIEWFGKNYDQATDGLRL